MSSRVNKSLTTSGDIKPNFYTKAKRSCQKVSLEKPENLTRKCYQRKEDGIWRRRTLTRMLTVTTQTLMGVNRRVTQTPRAVFFFLPSFPTTQRGLCARDWEELGYISGMAGLLKVRWKTWKTKRSFVATWRNDLSISLQLQRFSDHTQ